MSSQTDNQISTNSEFEVDIKDNITTVKIPETYVEKMLTELQEETLLLFEKEFVYRYTDDDKDYASTVKLGNTSPPLIPSYRPRWNRRRDDRQRGEKRGWNDQQNDKHSHFSQNKRRSYGYNNDYRR